jgi:hypothetical protein
MKKINIIYRGCNLENPNDSPRKGRPKGFDKRDCFDTLHRAISSCHCVGEIFIIMDGGRGYLSDHIESKGYTITYIDLKSNEKSLAYCYNLASNLQDGNNLYFVEDDYWHTEDALTIINEGVDYMGLVTGYDHLDRYTSTDDITYGKEYITLSQNRHWRTAESTTCTWACSAEVYSHIHNIASEELLEDRRFFRRVYMEKQIRLFTPIPAVTSHMMEDYGSPFFNYN